MPWYAALFWITLGLLWIALQALPYVSWYRRGPEPAPGSRRQARQAPAPTRESIVQQHSDAGMLSLNEKNWAEAVSAFDRALDVLGAKPPRSVLGLRFRRRKAESPDDSDRKLPLLLYRGFALEQLGELEKAMADYQNCQAIYGSLQQDPQYLAAVRQGLLLARLGRADDAEQHLRRTLAALRQAPEPVLQLQIETLEILVGLSRQIRNPARALEYAQEGLRAGHHLRDAAAQANFLRAAGDALQALDRPDEALRSYEQSLDLYRRIGETGHQAPVKRDIALVYQLTGQWDKALAWLQACLVEEEREQNKQSQARLCYDIACLHIDQGNLQDAGKLLQQSISLFRQAEDHEGIDRVGRTMMGLSILVHRRVTAHQMTFRDVERGSAKSEKEGK